MLISRLIWIAAVGGLGAAWCSAAIPSYEQSWQFCNELQADYAKRQGAALIERFDNAQMMRRAIAPLGSELIGNAEIQAAWAASFAPRLKEEIDALHFYKNLQFEQIALLEGQRVAVAILQTPEGVFTALLLWLDQRPEGGLSIVDFRTLAQSLEATARVRHGILITTGLFTKTLDEEERVLAFAGPQAGLIKQFHERFSQGKPDSAWDLWQMLPESVAATRYWRDMRDALALTGCAPARKHAVAEFVQRGEINPLLGLMEAQASKDPAAILDAFDRVSTAVLHSPFARAQKAAVLVSLGRAAEALRLARSLSELNPFSVQAHLVATQAAVGAGEPEAAVAALRAWRRLVSGKSIDELLAKDATLSPFRATEAYRRWLAEPENPLFKETPPT